MWWRWRADDNRLWIFEFRPRQPEADHSVIAKLHFDEDRTERTILDDVKVLDKVILENTNPTESRAQIETMLKSLPAQDAAADVLREQLIYLSGLTYELQGNNDNALRIYLQLIEAHPDSLWSRLAQSRIIPKP